MSEQSKMERRIRRLLAREGRRLWKVRPGRYEAEYGPYAVIDQANRHIVARGCTLEELAAEEHTVD